MPGLVTVTTPAASAQLTSLPVAKDELGVTDSSADIRIGQYIDRASAVIAAYCGRKFGLQVLAETFHLTYVSAQVGPYGTPTDRAKPLILTGAPVVSVVFVTENGTLLDPAVDYEIDSEAGMMWRLVGGNRYQWSAPLVVVAYSTGWALPNDLNRTLPADVEDVCLALVRSAYFAAGRDPNIAMDSLNGDRTQFWDRSTGGMALDDDLKLQLADYVNRAW